MKFSRRAWSSPRAKASAWAAGAALLVAALGGLATEIGPWYLALRQPPWKPPDLWFGPIWTLIYTLTAAAGVRVWETAQHAAQRRFWLCQLGLNSVLNVLWSVLFFSLHRPDWAQIEVVFLWLSVLLLYSYGRSRLRSAGWLLLPYLVWASFAACLNFAVVRLN